MGCASSKLDDLPAVALCRERCGFLEAAIQQRYLLAESHVAYTHSLKGIGHSLHLFINHHHSHVDSPTLNLPPQRKGDPQEENKEVENNSPNKKAELPSSHHPGSGTDSGHLESDSDSDSHLDSDHSPHHLGNFETGPSYTEVQQPGYTRYPNPETMGHHLPPPPYTHMNYMKNSSMPPSIIYEQRPSSPQRVFIGESYYGYSSSGSGPGYYYGSSTDAPASKPPPPPPSPPRSNGWDFLNPYEDIEEELASRSRNLSSTLHKLHLWVIRYFRI